MTRSELIVALLDLPPSSEDIELFFFKDREYRTFSVVSVSHEQKTEGGIGPHPVIYIEES